MPFFTVISLHVIIFYCIKVIQHGIEYFINDVVSNSAWICLLLSLIHYSPHARLFLNLMLIIPFIGTLDDLAEIIEG